jgi:uncharacterized protein YqkB
MTYHPRGRINQGADSVLSLVVGSMAHKKGQFDISDVDNPSPFTRLGPGPEFIIKPEVAHYGGNTGIKPDGSAAISGVKSFAPDGEIAEHAGTSFATPRVAALATGLYQEMEEEFDPLLIKGLIIHSAKYPDNMAIPYEERTKYVGFGKPSTIPEILYNDPNEITLVMRSRLLKGRYIDILDFPMPACMIQDGYYTGQIIATLVYSPVLNESQGSEYCQSNIDVSIGTYDEKEDKSIPDDKENKDATRRPVLNPVGRKNSYNIFRDDFYSKKIMKTAQNSFALRERLLIRFGDKYYPVKKYAVDLSELTPANRRNYVSSNKLWYLKIDGLYRSFTEQQAVQNFVRPSQDFCLVITVRDPSGKMKVYDETVHNLDINNFWHSQITLASQITVKN